MPRKMRLALVGAAIAVATSGVTIVTAGVASAAGPPIVTISSGPFNQGQSITVSGTGFPTRSQDPSGLTILQCGDPGGTLPADDGGCDGSTGSPLPVLTDSSGNFSTTYTVSELSTSDGSNINCSLTGNCVLWVGEDHAAMFSDGVTEGFSSGFLMTGTLPAFASSSSVSFHQGTFGSFGIAATGSPVPTITESGALPSSVSFTGGTGSASLTGTPVSGAASYHITLTATNSGGAVNQSFTLNVSSATSFAIAATLPGVATPGASYSFPLTAVGPFTSPIKWKTSKLPHGLKINKATGLISGVLKTKDKPGTYPFTATAKDHSKPKLQGHGPVTVTQNFTLTVN
jgi:hypothetical protein